MSIGIGCAMAFSQSFTFGKCISVSQMITFPNLPEKTERWVVGALDQAYSCRSCTPAGLASSRHARRLRSISADTRRALAAMVRDGLIAPLVGMKEASVIKRLAMPCALQSRSTTPVEGSLLITHVPQG